MSTAIRMNVQSPPDGYGPVHPDNLAKDNSDNLLRICRKFPESPLFFPGGEYHFSGFRFTYALADPVSTRYLMIDWEGEEEGTFFHCDATTAGFLFTLSDVGNVNLHGITFDGSKSTEKRLTGLLSIVDGHSTAMNVLEEEDDPQYHSASTGQVDDASEDAMGAECVDQGGCPPRVVAPVVCPEQVVLPFVDSSYAPRPYSVRISQCGFRNLASTTGKSYLTGLEIEGSFELVDVSRCTFRNLIYTTPCVNLRKGAMGIGVVADGEVSVKECVFSDIYSQLLINGKLTIENYNSDGIKVFDLGLLGLPLRLPTAKVVVKRCTFTNMGRRSLKSQVFNTEFMSNRVYRTHINGNMRVVGSADVDLQFGGGTIESNEFFYSTGNLMLNGVISATPGYENARPTIIEGNVIEIGDGTTMAAVIHFGMFSTHLSSVARKWVVEANTFKGVCKSFLVISLFCVHYYQREILPPPPPPRSKWTSLPRWRRTYQAIAINRNIIKRAMKSLVHIEGGYDKCFPQNLHFGTSGIATQNFCQEVEIPPIPIFTEDKVDRTPRDDTDNIKIYPWNSIKSAGLGNVNIDDTLSTSDDE